VVWLRFYGWQMACIHFSSAKLSCYSTSAKSTNVTDWKGGFMTGNEKADAAEESGARGSSHEGNPKLKGSGTLKTVMVALDVVEYLAEHDRFVRLTDISRDLDLPKGRVHRILATLKSRQYARQDKLTRGYSLGLKAWLLGRGAKIVEALIDVVRPELERLCSEAQETVVLGMLDDDMILNIYTKRGPHPIHAFVGEGTRAPIHATSNGKSILGLLDEDFILELVERGLERYTEKTVTDFETLRRDVEEAKRLGYAVVIDEWAEGLSAIGAPLRTQNPLSLMSIGVGLPTSRICDARIRELGEMVLDATERVADRLGL
jgi:DNA-binding IclR family transcriptional regulator